MARYTFQIEIPEELSRFKLPCGVNDRLQSLLDRQDGGERLTAPERREAEGLVDLSELLTLLKLRVRPVRPESVREREPPG